MVKVNLGVAGAGEFNFVSFVFDALLGNNFEAEVASNKIRLYSDAKDFIELLGKFDADAKGDNPLDYVEKITSFRSVVDGKESYKISGLNVTGDMLTFDALSDYLNSVSYDVTGNGGDNVLTSAGKADKLYGLAGSDLLEAGGGADVLDGGKGADRMIGGTGNDKYYVDNAGDRIVETNDDNNADVAYVSANFNMANAKFVETVILQGKADYKIVGNAFDNVIRGNNGDNRLDGGKGKDELSGGKGDDTYVVDQKKDEINESRNSGDDAVGSANLSINLRDYDNVEDIFLLGKAKLSATGDSSGNRIVGNDGNNRIAGGGGNDLLTGDKGADTFIFSKGDRRDTITDFDATGRGQDRIALDDFGRLKFRDLDIDRVGKHDVDIDLGRGDHLILRDVNIKDIDASDFIF